MAFKMTYNEAMTIQRAQMVWYRRAIGRRGIKAIRKATTCPAHINPNKPMNVSEINGLVPRGSSFEGLVNHWPTDNGDQTKAAWHDAIRRGLF